MDEALAGYLSGLQTVRATAATALTTGVVDKTTFSFMQEWPSVTSARLSKGFLAVPKFELLKKPPERTQNPVPAISWNAIPGTKRRRPVSDENEDTATAVPVFKPASDAFQGEKRVKKAEPEGNYRQGLRKPYVCPVPQQKASEETNELKGQEERLVSMIEGEIMCRDLGVAWSDIAGLDFAKKAVNEAIVWPLLRPELFTGLRAPPKGLLLFGPPGTGKTLIGKAIASEAKATFFNISASSLTSKWIGESEKLVRILFTLATKHQPSVIFVDEIDSLLSSRSENEQESSRRIKTEFLSRLDGAATSKEDRILVIGTTNRPQELDEAMRRRMAKRLYIPLPNAEGRLQLLRHLMTSGGLRHCLREEDFGELVRMTKGYSGADLHILCSEAALAPLRSMGDIRSVAADTLPPVSIQDFLSALQAVRPSVAPRDLDSLQRWNAEFGSFQLDPASLNT